jgi:hypothetical protein
MGGSESWRQEAMKNKKRSLDKNLPTRNKYSKGSVLENELRNFAADFSENATDFFAAI